MSLDSNIQPAFAASSATELAQLFASYGVRTDHPIDAFLTETQELIELKSVVRTLSAPVWREQIVLICGPSGSGKELIARGLHGSPPVTSQFIAVNMAALPDTLASSLLQGHRAGTFTGGTSDKEGVFEAASTLDADKKSGRTTGTVFLDEIGDMPLSQQAILLRILEQREVLPIGGTRPCKINCRIIAATNKDLNAEVIAGRFRDDLFARLSEITLSIPPWSARETDLRILCEHFGLPAEAVETIKNSPLLERHGARHIRAVAARYRLTNKLTI